LDGVFIYLNTDLDLTSAADLTALAAAFEAGGVPPLHVTRGEDRQWYATFEADHRRSARRGCVPWSWTVVRDVRGGPSALRA